MQQANGLMTTKVDLGREELMGSVCQRIFAETLLTGIPLETAWAFEQCGLSLYCTLHVIALISRGRGA